MWRSLPLTSAGSFRLPGRMEDNMRAVLMSIDVYKRQAFQQGKRRQACGKEDPGLAWIVLRWAGTCLLYTSYLITKYMALTEEEALAIRWDMGAFDDAVKGGSRALDATMDVSPRCV